MPNVENNDPSFEGDYDIQLNPLERFKFTDQEYVDYLVNNIVPGVEKKGERFDYKKDKNKPVLKSFKTMVFGWKDSGKTHFIHTVAELDPNHGNKKDNSGVKYDPRLNHVKYLLENEHIVKGNPEEYLDNEGKGFLLRTKFSNYPIRYRSGFYPDGPMPTMGDPVAFMKELTIFLKSVVWAHDNPEIFSKMTVSSKYPKGMKSPNAAVYENYSIVTNEIMNYVRTTSHDDKSEILEKKGQELGAPMIKKFDNWDIRNCNWEYLGGFIQIVMPLIHYVATARAKKVWKDSRPTDDDDAQLYSNATHAFNIILYLYRDVDPETGINTFWGQISSSDFMNDGITFSKIRNPTYPKLVGEVTKISHANILEKNGKWIEEEINGEICDVWIENKGEKNDN